MKTATRIVLFGLILFEVAALGQTIPQVVTNLLIFPGPQAQAVQQVTAQVVGNPGTQTYYVWIVADYPFGNATPSPGTMVRNAPAVLSSQESLRISWNPVAGASTYDVLLTTTDSTPSGACNCAAAVATSGTQVSVTSSTLSSYVVSTFPGNATAQTGIIRMPDTAGINWRDSSNSSDLSLGINASQNWLQFRGDLVPGVVGSITTGHCVEWAGSYTLEDAGAACGSGGGGVSSIQFDSNTSLTGAVVVNDGAGLAPASQTGQTVTLSLNQASTSLFGGLTLGGDLGGAYNAQQVVGLHFGSTAIPLNSTPPSSGQCLSYNGTNIGGTSCGGGSSPATAFVNALAINGSGFRVATVNHVYLWYLQLSQPVKFASMCYNVQAVNTTGKSDIGIYALAGGNLLADIGAAAWGSTGTTCTATAQGSVTLAAGDYVIAFTSSDTSSEILEGGNLYITPLFEFDAGTSSAGALPASISAPTISWANGKSIFLSLHN